MLAMPYKLLLRQEENQHAPINTGRAVRAISAPTWQQPHLPSILSLKWPIKFFNLSEVK
jgi:hypothetical protein